MDGFDEAALDFETGVVGVVEYAELRVAALAVKVELPVGILVEVDAPLDEAPDAFWSAFDHLFDGARVADVVARDEGVADVFFKVVHFEVCHRGNASLCFGRVGFVQGGLAYKGYFPFSCFGHLKRIAHSGYAGADH